MLHQTITVITTTSATAARAANLTNSFFPLPTYI
jgi:hypothetical protein